MAEKKEQYGNEKKKMEEDPLYTPGFKKRAKKCKKCLMAGFPPLIEGDFQAGDFGWEVER